MDFLKDQRLQSSNESDIETERSKSYSEQNRAQIENEKRCEWENMIFKICSSKGALKYFGCRYRTGLFCDYISTKRASE